MRVVGDDDDTIRRSGFARIRCFLPLSLKERPPNLSGSMCRARVNRMIWWLGSDYWTIGKDGRIEEVPERSQRPAVSLGDAGMDRAVAHCHMLAVELDAERRYGVSLFSLMARVRAGGGRVGGGADGEFDVDAVAERVRAAVCGFFAGLVDV